MRRFIFLLIFFFVTSLFAEVPAELLGLWEGKDRYIYFEEDGFVAVVYKLYYGKYLDRAAEKKEWGEKKKRDRNLASSIQVLPIEVDFLPKRECVWEIKVSGKGRETYKVPLSLIGGKLYLSFLLKEEALDGEFWVEVNDSSQLGISPGHKKENLYGWYITENDVYRVRYWKTESEFHDEARAAFSVKEKEFTVRKQIFSGGSVFQAAPLKASIIANVKHYDIFPFKDFPSSHEAHSVGADSFTKVESTKSVEDFLELIDKQNSLPPPPLPPVFPSQESE